MKNIQKIEKPCIIIVEGFTDKIFIQFLLKEVIKFPQEDLTKIQIFTLNNKDILKWRKLGLLFKEYDDLIQGILIILDKDSSFESTKQKIENFLKQFNREFPNAFFDYYIIPDEAEKGRELEDYLINRAKYHIFLKNFWQCFKNTKDKIPIKKLSKKLFYFYLLFCPDCNYEGLSLSENLMESCFRNCFELNAEPPQDEELIKKLKEFMDKCSNIKFIPTDGENFEIQPQRGTGKEQTPKGGGKK